MNSGIDILNFNWNDYKSDCPVILNKHCLLRITGGTLKFSA